MLINLCCSVGQFCSINGLYFAIGGVLTLHFDYLFEIKLVLWLWARCQTNRVINEYLLHSAVEIHIGTQVPSVNTL